MTVVHCLLCTHFKLLNAQVVNVGCGLDTRAWRLGIGAPLPPVSWIDLDTTEIIELKRKLLQVRDSVCENVDVSTARTPPSFRNS